MKAFYFETEDGIKLCFACAVKQALAGAENEEFIVIREEKHELIICDACERFISG